MKSIRDAEETMVSELKVPRDEAKIYLLLLAKGKMSKNNIASNIDIDETAVEKGVLGLIDKGTCIELNGEYEALNPRFAITNMYRMMCLANNIEVKRNKVVDQLATMLEKSYEDARTK